MIIKNYIVGKLLGKEEFKNIKGISLILPYKNGCLIEIEIENLPNKKKFEPFYIAFSNYNNLVKEEISMDNYKSSQSITNNFSESELLPPIISNNGYAYIRFYTELYQADELLNKKINIYQKTDEESNKLTLVTSSLIEKPSAAYEEK